MAKKPGQSKRNGQSKRPVVKIQTTVSDAQMLKARTALGMSAVKPRVKTATPSKGKRAKSSPQPMTVTAREGRLGRSGTAYKNTGAAVIGEVSDPNSPFRQAVSRAFTDIGASRDKMLRGAEEKANQREVRRLTKKIRREKTNMEAPDMRRATTPAVTVDRPAPAAARPAAPRPASSTVARPAPLPSRRPAAQSTSNLPAGGYSPRAMSGDYSTAQPKLDTNKGYEPNKTGFFDKMHRSLGGKGNATYKYPTGDNRSDKD